MRPSSLGRDAEVGRVVAASTNVRGVYSVDREFTDADEALLVEFATRAALIVGCLRAVGRLADPVDARS